MFGLQSVQSLQALLVVQENTLGGRIAQEHEYVGEVQAGLSASMAGLRSEMLENISLVAGEVTNTASELNGAIDAVDAKFGEEIGSQSEMFKELCLSVAKDTDDKVGTVDDRLTASLSDIKQDILDLHGRADRIAEGHSTAVELIYKKFDDHADAHHDKVESAKADLQGRHDERHSSMVEKLEALAGQHGSHKNEVREAIDQCSASWESLHSKHSSQQNQRVDALEVSHGLQLQSRWRIPTAAVS